MPERISEAEEYALFGYPDSEVQDCDFLQAIFSAADPPPTTVLDIACGTGRHAVEMARRGYAVTGIDRSADMLAYAGDAARSAGVSLTLAQQDMRYLSFEQPFDGAYILFNTLMQLVNNDDLLAFLGVVHAALRPGGVLVVEVGNLWPLIAGGEMTDKLYRSEEERGGVRRERCFGTAVGPLDNVMHRLDQRRFWRDGVELEPQTNATRIRLFSLSELDLACRLTGFHVGGVYGGMDLGKPIGDWHAAVPAAEAPRSYVLVLER